MSTATSAVCVTGLVIVDTAGYWSPVGELAIMLLIQVGGFGFMTGSTLLLFLLVRRRTGLRDRVLVQEAIGVPQLGVGVSVVPVGERLVPRRQVDEPQLGSTLATRPQRLPLG